MQSPPETIVIHAHGSSSPHTAIVPPAVMLKFVTDPRRGTEICMLRRPRDYLTVCKQNKPRFQAGPGQTYIDLDISFSPRINSSFPNGLYKCDIITDGNVPVLALGDNQEQFANVPFGSDCKLSQVVNFLAEWQQGYPIIIWVAACSAAVDTVHFAPIAAVTGRQISDSTNVTHAQSNYDRHVNKWTNPNYRSPSANDAMEDIEQPIPSYEELFGEPEQPPVRSGFGFGAQPQAPAPVSGSLFGGPPAQEPVRYGFGFGTQSQAPAPVSGSLFGGPPAQSGFSGFGQSPAPSPGWSQASPSGFLKFGGKRKRRKTYRKNGRKRRNTRKRT